MPHGICCKPHAIIYYCSAIISSILHHQSRKTISIGIEYIRSTVTYLGGQVESEVTASGQSIFNQQRNLIGQAELDRLGKTSSLAEVYKVLEGEGQGDGFGELDFDVKVWLLDIVVAS
jgi:hypothetical protein